MLRVRLNDSYVRALEDAGLLPLVVPPLRGAGAASALIRSVSGLVLSGGEDVEPARYGAAGHAALRATHPERDAWELALIEEARHQGTPTLAICRGAQLLNVALGGSLLQDIPTERPGSLDHEPADGRRNRVHGVEVEPGSRLAAALGATRLEVNSVHHQGLDRTAPSLRVSATAPDGLVEGVETIDGAWWVLGVQWHPEDLIGSPEPWEQRLFASFANECRARATARHGVDG